MGKWIGVLLGAVIGLQAAEVSQARLMQGNEAREILIRAYAFLERQPAFSLEAVTVNEDAVSGKKMIVEIRSRVQVDLDRRGRIMVEVDGENRHRTYRIDRGRFLVWDRPSNLYGELKVPEENDKALDYLYDRFGVETPLANLLYSDLRKRLLPKARGYDLGLRTLHGVRCRYLIFVDSSRELEVWIRSEGDPLIERFVLIDRSTPLMLHSTTDLHWRSLGRLKGRPFDLRLPASAHRIPVLPAP